MTTEFTLFLRFKIILDSPLGPKNESIHILLEESVMMIQRKEPAEFSRISCRNLSSVSAARPFSVLRDHKKFKRAAA
jgi:hypothetical protein